MQWYNQHGTLRGTNAPVAAVLLYRKHIITGQAYVEQLIRCLESQGVLPIPVFINGVEAHTIVRPLSAWPCDVRPCCTPIMVDLLV